MTTTEKPLSELVRDLPPDLETEIRDFVEFLLQKRRKGAASPEVRGWPPGYFEEVIGSLPDFPDVDGDTGGIDPALDRTDEDLRFDPPEERDSQGTAE